MLQSKVNIGKRDRLIQIAQPTISTGVNRPATNEDKISGWTLLAEVWAWVRPFKGNEAMIAERLTEGHYVIANIRYRSDIKTKMMFLYNSRAYEISSITPTEDRNRSLELVGNLLDNFEWPLT